MTEVVTAHRPLPSILSIMHNNVPRLDRGANVNPAVIDANNILFVSLPIIKKKHFRRERITAINIIDNNPRIEITRGYLNSVKDINSLKKIATELGIYNQGGGREPLIEKILDKVKTLDSYNTM